MTVLLPFLIAFLIGFLISKKWIKSVNSYSVLLLRVSIGMGLGIGIISIFTFLSLFIPGVNEIEFSSKLINKFVLILIAILILVLLLIEIVEIRKESKQLKISFQFILLSLFFILSLIFVFDRLWLISAENSHGGWDAWAIWNLHARFIYFAGNNWKNLFTELLVWSHVDYPLMTPSMILFGWKILGNDTRLIPLILGGVFTFATIGVLFASLLHLRNYFVAILGSLVLAFSIPFIREGAFQYADIPLAYYYLCVISLTLISRDKRVTGQNLFILIGVLLGLSTWTKNEGFIFMLSYLLIMGLNDLKRKTFDKRKWFGISAGVFPVIVVVELFKTLTIGNDILNSVNTHNIFVLLTDIDRYKLILNLTFKYITEFANGNLSIIIFLMILILITGVEQSRKIIDCLPVIGIILLTFTFYLFIYVVTPKDVSWHMQTSFTRLLIHLYPSLLLVIFNLIKDPFNLNKE